MLRIFNEPFEGLKLFSSEIEYGMWTSTIKFEIPDLTNGKWSKTAFILLDHLDFENSLQKAITYLDVRYAQFKNPREKHLGIAKNILNKTFKK